MSTVITVETPELGDRSYLVHDGDVALAVDPQRDIDRMLHAAEAAGVQIVAVAETHMHNDYVTGGFALATQTGADYLVAGADDVAFERRPMADGDQVKVGRMVVQAMATPGHTPNHLSYVVLEDGHPQAVFTGGSLLYGTVGRTDLIGSEVTEDLTRAQHRSAHRLVHELPADVAVYPTHGFGSFCSSASGSGQDSSTIGQEARSNLALTADDEDTFVKSLLAGLTAYPRYYAQMAAINRSGPGAAPSGLPDRVDAAVLRERIRAGEWAVDLRSRVSFAAAHLPGSLSIELSEPFATYLGWTIRWGTPLSLLGESEDQVAEARRQLTRIGIDDLAGAAVGPLEDLLDGGAGPASYRVATFSDLAEAGRAGQQLLVLDVRRRDEWDAGHLREAMHIPFYDLEDRIGEVPDAPEVWVHCASGFRASVGSSLLDRAGRRAVLIDDDWDRASETGLEVTRG